jgi:death-on-curing protein
MTMDEPRWLNLRFVEAVHARQLAEHGGTNGLRDRAGLESALARPRQLFAYVGANVDMHSLAAAYAFGMARNYPFVDGNKRTAYVACRTFLVLNRHDIVGPLTERYPIFLALAAGEIDEDELTEWLRARVRSDQVSEPAATYR